MVLLAALATAAVMCQAVTAYIVVSAAAGIGAGEADLLTIAALAVLLKVTGVVKTAALMAAVRAAEESCADTRAALVRRVAGGEPADIERLGRDAVAGRLDHDLGALSAAAWALITLCQSAVLIVACLLCVVAAAPRAVLGLGLLAGAAALVRAWSGRRVAAAGDAVLAAEHRVTARTYDLLGGFRDLKAAPGRDADFLRAGLEPAVRHAGRLHRRAGAALAARAQAGDLLVYGLLGLAGFILPGGGGEAGHHALIVAVGLLVFLIDRVDSLAADLPPIIEGAAALDRIQALERRLPERPGTVDRAAPDRFAMMALEGVTFRPGEGGWFTLGPVDLRLGNPEICLIVGGTGAGKTTLLKLLAGLYQPDDGSVLVDGRRLAPESHRGLVSAVFRDFHLFDDEPVADEDWAAAAALLRLLGLDAVVHRRDGRWSAAALSGGQRRRMALVAAWLERRPLLLLDDWTVDQDPPMRRVFFDEVLPRLKAEGRTVVVTVHDADPLPPADRVIRMEAGRIVVAGSSGGGGRAPASSPDPAGSGA